MADPVTPARAPAGDGSIVATAPAARPEQPKFIPFGRGTAWAPRH